MTHTTSKRRRPRAEFRASEPVRVERVSFPDDLLDELLEPLNAADSDALRAELERIATAYRTSRRLQLRRPSRPTVAATLRAVSRMAGGLAAPLESLHPAVRACLAEHLYVPDSASTAKQLHIQSIVHAVRELAEAVEMTHRSADARSDGQQLSRDLFQRAKMAVDFYRQMERLSMPAEWLLMMIQRHLLPPSWDHGGDAVSALGSQLRWLERAAAVAARVESKQRGPESDSTLYIAVKDLIALYESLVQTPATHSSSVGGDYKGEARSAAGKWVGQAMNLVDPAGPRRGVRDALEHALWPSRGKLSAEKARRRREEYERVILESIAAIPLVANNSHP